MGKLSMPKEEKCRDEKRDLGVSKLMGKLVFTRRNPIGKLSSDYVRIGWEFKKIVCVLQAFH